MDKRENALQEQDHPLKNTDNAFVQVGADGQPVIPEQAERNAEPDQLQEDPAPVYDKP